MWWQRDLWVGGPLDSRRRRQDLLEEGGWVHPFLAKVGLCHCKIFYPVRSSLLQNRQRALVVSLWAPLTQWAASAYSPQGLMTAWDQWGTPRSCSWHRSSWCKCRHRQCLFWTPVWGFGQCNGRETLSGCVRWWWCSMMMKSPTSGNRQSLSGTQCLLAWWSQSVWRRRLITPSVGISSLPML